jgi:hypothetical protein
MCGPGPSSRDVARPGHRELGEVGEDADGPLGLVGDRLALLGEAQQGRLAGRRPAVLRRRVLVHLLGRPLAEQVLGEGHPWRVEVEEAHLAVAFVLVAVDHSDGRRPRRPLAEHVLLAGEPDVELAAQDRERVRVPAVDVERRPALRLEPRVGHYKLGPVDQDPDGRLSDIHEVLAFA